MALYSGICNNGTFVSSDGYRLQDLNSSYITAIPTTNKYKIILNNVVYRVNLNLNTKESE